MITVRHLTKRYGDLTAVKDISFEVAAGDVYGLLGPNGAGKTTTLRVLATLIDAQAEALSVCGHDVFNRSAEVRRHIGVVNGGMGLYDRLTGREVLHYFGGLYGLSKAAINQRIRELDDLLHLGDTLDKQTQTFSTGMKQKIVIARAVLHDPPVIFFDEATSGLDIMARRAVMQFVKDYPSDSRAVIYSTHVMHEVETLCNRVGILHQGVLLRDSTTAALLAETRTSNLEDAFFSLLEAQAVAL
jgi:sodium transport system ATP-binding protein